MTFITSLTIYIYFCMKFMFFNGDECSSCFPPLSSFVMNNYWREWWQELFLLNLGSEPRLIKKCSKSWLCRNFLNILLNICLSPKFHMKFAETLKQSAFFFKIIQFFFSNSTKFPFENTFLGVSHRLLEFTLGKNEFNVLPEASLARREIVTTWVEFEKMSYKGRSTARIEVLTKAKVAIKKTKVRFKIDSLNLLSALAVSENISPFGSVFTRF